MLEEIVNETDETNRVTKLSHATLHLAWVAPTRDESFDICRMRHQMSHAR